MSLMWAPALVAAGVAWACGNAVAVTAGERESAPSAVDAAQVATSPVDLNTIRLKVATFDPVVGTPTLPTVDKISAHPAGVRGAYLVQFDRPITGADRAALEAAGASIKGYVPMMALEVVMTGDSAAAVKAVPGVRWVGVYQPAYKLYPGLLQEVQANKQLTELIKLQVSVFPGEEQGALPQIKALGGRVLRVDRGRSFAVAEVEIAANHLSDLAHIPLVRYIEEVYHQTPLNDRSRFYTGLADIANDTFTGGLDPSLDGNDEGAGFQVKYGHMDTGIEIAHADFSTATITFEPGADSSDLDNGHGTHTAGSIVGDGGAWATVPQVPPGSGSVSQDKWRGMTPQAALYHISFENGYSDRQMFERQSEEGVHISSNSWSWCSGVQCNPIPDYNTNAAVWDEGVWDADDDVTGLQPLIAFFAAGNNGGYVAYNGCSSTGADWVDTPGTAKNVIAVANNETDRGDAGMCGSYSVLGNNVEEVNASSSRGPVDPDGTGQGLFKPDVSNIGGYWVMSTEASGTASVCSGTYVLPDCPTDCSDTGSEYAFANGTSMSTPLTAGLGGVLYQDLVVNLGVSSPKPSLVKAMLINGARDLQPAGCNYTFEVDQSVIHEGWGFVQAVDSLYGPGGTPSDRRIEFENEVTANAVATGGQYPLQITANAGTPLKVTLVWTDYPAAAGSGSPLVVNDLDLEISGPDGTFLGNNFNGNWSVTGGTPDRYNVVENVYIQNPTGGTYTITVKGFQVSQDQEPDKAGINQDFSLVWSGDLGGCTAPEQCDDGLWCNGAEDCVSGSCVPGTPPNCSDGVGCTDDSCNEKADSCDNVPNNANCDNGLYCDGAETCDALLDCQQGTAVNCNDGVACTDDSCNETTDSCDNIANDANCDNGLYCDGAETCDALLDCQPGTAINCNDGVACTDDSCNETTDSCDNIANNANCDNGLFCDGTETCDAVLDCQPGSDPCVDGVACTDDSCDEPTDTCNNVANDANCDNGLFCDGAETCDALLDCQPGTAVNCNDGVGCTDDSCNETTDSCDNVPNNANCDNGLYCDGAETCDALLDCQPGTAVNCNDDVACTDDSCNETTDSCDNIPNDALCDNGQYCDGAETCDALLDCQPGSAVDCNDGVGCTDDSCNETTDSCDNIANNANCDNGLFCDGTETCDAVLDCQPGSDPCNDGVGCTDDSCDEPTDTCNNVANDANCDNGLFCDGAETCDALLDCQPGTAVNCDDGVGCTDDSCNETTDSCDNVPNNANCDNGLYCDGAETCDALLDCQPGTAVNCNDGVACTDDSCNETTDSCDNIPNDALCDNGQYCDGAETCDALLDCQPGSAVDCNDGVGCTDDSCNETTDSCDNVPNDANCDDGLFCTGVETCDAVLDCQAGADPCPGQDCDEVDDVCVPVTCNGNDTCETGEDCSNCPADCFSGPGAVCGNDVCETADGEDCTSCPDDCNSVLTGGPSGRYCCGDGTAKYGVTCADARCTGGGNTCTNDPAVPSCCGDEFCEGTEDVINCAVDCGCTGPADCDDSNECTADDCVEGACQNTPVADDTPCTGGVCCGGTCTVPVCFIAADCDDLEACTADSCSSAGSCSAACDNAWASCGLPDGCCGPACTPETDPDCAACLPKGEPCDPANDLCCAYCHPLKLTCK